MGETNPQEWPWVMVGPFPLLAEPSYDPGIQGETSVKVCVGDTPMRVRIDHVTPVPYEANTWLYMAWLGPHDLDVLHAACSHYAREHNDSSALKAYERIQEYMQSVRAFRRGSVEL
jgi:hypothetical protein